MPTPASVRIPSYRLQKARGLAVVTIDGKDRYLGPYDSPESREKYHRLVHEWLTRESAEPPPCADDPGPTINELMLAFSDRHVVGYYVKDGNPTSEQDNIRQALRFVRRLYEHSPAKEFGPLALKAVRSAMIQSGRCRNLINKDIHRVRRMFKWAASEEILPASVYQALETVEALPKGRSQARETAPVKPVPIEVVNATLPHLPPVVQAMVKIQLLSGARPGEVCSMRPMDFDRSDPSCWSYTPSSHKTEHHGKARTIYLGPKAQSVLAPFLADRSPDAFLFQPREAELQRNALKRKSRQSKLTPSAGSSDLLCEAFQLLTTVVATDPFYDLGRRQFAVGLDDGALAVDPFRLDRVEPRRLHRQRSTTRSARPPSAFGPAVVRLDPRPDPRR